MAQGKRKYFIERVGPMQVIQVYADNFDKLPLKEKLFAYYLCQAALAGRNISFDQIHKNALEIKELLGAIVFNPKGIESRLLEKIEKYFKLFSKNNGMYAASTDSKKILPEFTFEELADSLEIAIQNGAKIELKNGENLQEKLLRLKPYIFEPDIDATLDIAIKYHDGISPEEVKEWAKTGMEKNPLNSKVIKEENGEIKEIIWRAGNKREKPGMYANELQKIIKHLKAAIPYASSAHQRKTLRSLIRHFETGDLDDFRKFNINWVKDNTAIDYNIGFIEVYFDPRSQKGHYDGSVFSIDPVQTEIVKKLAANAQYFEEKNPWDEKYKNKNINPSVSTVVNILTENGTGAIINFIGLNLPNEEFVREKYGSKSFVVKNKIEVKGIGEEKLLEEFCWDEEEIRTAEKYGPATENAHVALHEILGHASGKVSEKLVGSPTDYLPGCYSTIEEARAELVGLWHVFDDKLIEIGLVQDKKLGEELYREYVRSALLQLRKINQGGILTQDHMKAKQLIVNYILQEPDAAEVKIKGGKTFLRVVNFEKMHEMIGKLLAEVMRIKAEGNLTAAKELIETYGTKINTAWRDEVLERIKGLDLSLYTYCLMPKLRLIKDKNGRPKDVKVSYPMNLLKQLFDYSKSKAI